MSRALLRVMVITMMNQRQQQLQGMTHTHSDTGCWIWHGQISNSGYGRIKQVLDKKVVMLSAQAASYQAFTSSIPEGHLVKQSCGNRLCINPEHLELIKI